MKLLSNSRQILTRAWSMYGLYAIDVLAAAEVILSTLNNGDPRFGYAILAVSTLTKFLRLVKQNNMPPEADPQRGGKPGEERAQIQRGGKPGEEGP